MMRHTLTQLPGSFAFVAILCTALLMAHPCHAQKGQLEVSAGVGAISALQIGRAISAGFGGDHGAPADTGSSLCYFFSAHYFILDRLAIGASVGWQRLYGSGTSDPSGSALAPEWLYSYRLTYITVAPEVVFVYKNLSRGCRIYCLGGIGMSVINAQFNFAPGNIFGSPVVAKPTTPNFQITPFGISAGGRLRVNAEAGIGYKGLLSCGLSYFIGKNKSAHKPLPSFRVSE